VMHLLSPEDEEEDEEDEENDVDFWADDAKTASLHCASFRNDLSVSSSSIQREGDRVRR